MRLCKQKDHIEDQALLIANENIKDAEDLEGDQDIYSGTVHPNYLE